MLPVARRYAGERGISDPKVLGQEAVLVAERPRMDVEVLVVRVLHELRRRQQAVLRVTRDDQVLVRPDPVRVAGDEVESPVGVARSAYVRGSPLTTKS